MILLLVPLNDSITGSINRGQNGNFSQSVFRLDYYHLVGQPLNNIVAALTNTSEIFVKKSALVRHWIKSWFDSVHTSEEFSMSFNQLENFLINNSHIFGEYYNSSVRNLMKKLMTDVKYFGHHFFLHTTTMGFIGSSPVEGMNQSIKAGPFASKGNMSIDKSSDNQIRLSNYHELKRNIESGKEIIMCGQDHLLRSI